MVCVQKLEFQVQSRTAFRPDSTILRTSKQINVRLGRTLSNPSLVEINQTWKMVEVPFGDATFGMQVSPTLSSPDMHEM
jgi:hypothetical protein